MADKLDQMLGLAPTANTETSGKAAPPKKSKAEASAALPVYSPLRGVLIAAVTVSKIIGFEIIRIVSDQNKVKIGGIDGIDKTIFMIVTATVNKNSDLRFAINDLDEVLPLLTDPHLPMHIEMVDVPILNTIDNQDDASKTFEQIEKRPAWLSFGRAKHRLGNIGMAPKAELKKTPEWEICATLNLKSASFDEFKRHASRLKKTASKFFAQLEDTGLVFVIGSSAGSNVEIPMGTCLQADRVGRHAWPIQTYLNVLKCIKELQVEQFDTYISADTGLMKIEFQHTTIYQEPMTFEIIMPGKIVD